MASLGDNENALPCPPGITLLFATGDNGVSDDNDQCKGGRFAGQWPAGSVWVTGVGGTAGGARLYALVL